MSRRRFVIGLAAVPFVTRAQVQQSRPLLAILSPGPPRGLAAMGFKKALTQLGYEPGRNIDIVERFADGDESRLPALAAELVAMRPRVLYTHTSRAAAAAASATRTIPIVVGPASETTLVELAGGSLARPTTNVTGFALSSLELEKKCVALLIEAAPASTRIGVVVNPRNPVYLRYPGVLEGALTVRGKALIRLESSGLIDIDAALARSAAQRIDALYFPNDAIIAGYPQLRQRVLRFATSAGIPVASTNRDFARDGALLSISASIPLLTAGAAGYVDRILKGERPSDLPIQLPTVPSLIVNRKAAQALGLVIPSTLLALADEVIG